MSTDGPIPAGATDAANLFNGNMSGVTGYKLDSMTAIVTRTAGAVTSTVRFSASISMMFLGVMGKSSMTATGTSTAYMPLPSAVPASGRCAIGSAQAATRASSMSAMRRRCLEPGPGGSSNRSARFR
jgi:hypothetical protein